MSIPKIVLTVIRMPESVSSSSPGFLTAVRQERGSLRRDCRRHGHLMSKNKAKTWDAAGEVDQVGRHHLHDSHPWSSPLVK